MEQKEYIVADITAGIDSLRILDADGNDFKPSEPVSYKIMGEDGSTLKEGTLDSDNTISLEGVSTRKFRIVFEQYAVLEAKGFKNLDEDEKSANEESDDDEPSAESDEDDESQVADSRQSEET